MDIIFRASNKKGGSMVIRTMRFLKSVRKISLTCLYLSVPINLISIFIPTISMKVIMIALGESMLIAFIILTFLFWKCPYCGKRLPIEIEKIVENNKELYICPNCSKKITQ